MSIAWFPYSYFWHIRETQESRERADDARHRADTVADQVMELGARIDRLTLITQALFELLKVRTDIRDADLEAMIEKIDLQDGKLDGKVSRPPDVCPECSRPVSPKHNICIYCGIKVKKSSPF